MTGPRMLEGQVAVVTGAGRGIGRGGAVCLGRWGAKVSLLARTVDELEETKLLVEAAGGEALVCAVDVRDTGALLRALDRTEQVLGPITHLCNNAAVLDYLPFEDTTPEVWNRTLETNLGAAYHASRIIYPRLLARGGGTIHNVSSAAGIKGFAGETAYCAAKFGLEGLSRALALEAAPRGIIVTLSSPGIGTKPTSVTMKDFRQMPGERTEAWADPLVMGDAFAFLTYTRDQGLAGRRFNLFRLSELVRQKGTLDLRTDEALLAES